MNLKYHLLNLIRFRILSVMLHSKRSQSLDFCFDSNLEGYRLNTTVLKTKCVSKRINCILDCLTEPCCRSINYKKISSLQNEPTCEMLHNVVYNTSEKVLEPNSFYDHAYLTDPRKEYNESCFPKIQKKNTVTCPSNWKYIDDSCYYLSKTTAVDWDAARDDCLARDGDLAVPKNEEHNRYIYEASKERNILPAWIGVYRGKEGDKVYKFYTVKDVQVSYTNWNPNEPNFVNKKEYCTEILKNADGKWNDIRCSVSRHYICKMTL